MIEEYVEYEQDNGAITGDGVEFFYSAGYGVNYCTASVHMHPSVEILYFAQGSFYFYIQGKKYFAPQGSLVYFRPNTIHSVFTAEEGESYYYVLKIRQSLLSEMGSSEKGVLYLMQLSLPKEDKVFFWEADGITEFKPFLDAMIDNYRNPKFAEDIFIKANAVLLLGTILRKQFNANDILNENHANYTAMVQIYHAMDYVLKNYAEDITAKDCARAVGMSYAYFSHMFKKILGKSFIQYLTEVRINHAEKELVISDKSITQIAGECGFNNVSYFIAKYKELRGKTPHHYRKNT